MAIGSNGRDAERERILQLLPWRATGRLNVEQDRDVERAIQTDPELAARLAFMEEEASEASAANEALGAPLASSFHKLMDAIDAESPPELVRRTGMAGWVARAMEWLATPPGMWIGAACAAVIILLQAGVIGLMLSRGVDAPVHQTATGADRLASGSHVFVTFAENATISQINELLVKLEAKIVDGPRAGGIYGIALSKSDGSQADHEKLIEGLRDSGLAVAVFPAGPGG